MDDADRLGDRPRRARPRPAARRDDEVTPHTRPPTDYDAEHVPRPHGHVHPRHASRSSWSASPCSTTAARRPTGSSSTPSTGSRRRDRRRARRCACAPTVNSASRAAAPAPGTARRRARRASARCPGRDGLDGPDERDDADRRARRDLAVLARWLAARRLPRSPLARPPRSARRYAQGPHLHADRRDGRGADDLAARDAGRRAQLGLPLHVDARRDASRSQALHASASTGRPTTSSSSSPTSSRNEDGGLQIMYGIDGERDLTEHELDHLTGYEGAQPGAHRQRRLRPAPERRLRRGPRLDPTCTPRSSEPLPRAPVADRALAGRARDGGLARARPGDLGGARRAPALRVLEAHVLGRARSRRRGSPRSAATTTSPSEWRLIADEIRADILEQRRQRARRVPPALRHDALDASNLLGRARRLPAPRRRARPRARVLAIADELTENGLVLRYRTDETDDGLSGEEGTFLICSFWLVSALLEIGERQRARDALRAAAAHRLAARPLRRGARAGPGAPSRQLPAGVHAPGARRRGDASHPAGASGRAQRGSDPLMDITLFTDPACPFAFSAEPVRQRLRWHYGDQLRWRAAHDRAHARAGRGRRSWPRARPACSASTGCRSTPSPYPRTVLVGAGLPRGRRRAAERARRRGRAAAPAARARDARRAARRPRAARRGGRRRRARRRTSSPRWCADARGRGRAAARTSRPPAPLTRRPRARPQARRPAARSAATPRRATSCGARRRQFAIPGFNPVEAYEAAMANFAPDLPRRPRRSPSREVLAWAGEPLATAEIVASCRPTPPRGARGAGRRRRADPAGADFYWVAA